MWPFEENLSHQDALKKYRHWLRKWLLLGRNYFYLLLIPLVCLSLLVIYQGLKNKNAAPVHHHMSQITQPAAGVAPYSNYVRAEKAGQAADTAKQASAKGKDTKVAASKTNAQASGNIDLSRPVKGQVLLGMGTGYDAAFKDYRYHQGVDLAAGPGESVRAAMAGQIVAIKKDHKGFYEITLDHGHGWQTSYDSLASVNFSVGHQVIGGEFIGTLADQPAEGVSVNHLYFTLKYNGQPVDPNRYWK